MKNIWLRLLKYIQRKCDHRHMLADILEGDVCDRSVAWCPTCGAYQINDWAVCRPDPSLWIREKDNQAKAKTNESEGP